jgi:hypothetical protein
LFPAANGTVHTFSPRGTGRRGAVPNRYIATARPICAIRRFEISTEALGNLGIGSRLPLKFTHMTFSRRQRGQHTGLPLIKLEPALLQRLLILSTRGRKRILRLRSGGSRRVFQRPARFSASTGGADTSRRVRDALHRVEDVRVAQGNLTEAPQAYRDSLYRKLQVLGRPECDFPACFDLDGLSGCRIAPHAGCAISDLQDAETGDLDSFALLEMLGDQTDEIAEDGFTSPFCYLMLLRQSRRKMLKRDGAAGLGRSRWFRGFACHDGYPSLCAECAYGKKDMIRNWKKRGFDGQPTEPASRPPSKADHLVDARESTSTAHKWPISSVGAYNFAGVFDTLKISSRGGLRGSELLDHLVRAGEQRSRHFQAERLRGLEVDDKLVFHQGLNRQIGGLFTLENAIDIAGSVPMCRNSWQGMCQSGQ